MMSRSTRSNGSARSFSSAFFPSSAIATSWPCCFKRRERRSRLTSTSSTTRTRPVSGIGRRQEAAQERELPGGGLLAALDHVGVERRVPQADVPVECRNDRDDLRVVRDAVERV